MSQFYTPIKLNRDIFMLQLIAALGNINENVPGPQVTDEYIMAVGSHMGASIETEYKLFWKIDRVLTVDEYAHIIVDLKQRIQGNFSVVEKSDDKVIISTISSPFDEFMQQSPALAIMTSSLFGSIAARNFGWAKSVLSKYTVPDDALKSNEKNLSNYYITIYFKKTFEALEAKGQEYLPATQSVDSGVVEQLQLIEKVRSLYSKLNESEARWQEAMEHIEDAVVALDDQSRFIFVNRKWCEITGYPPQEVLGCNMVDRLIIPEEREYAYETIEKLSQGEALPPFFRHIIDSKGKIMFLRVVSVSTRDDRGHIIGSISFFHDVTKEKEIEVFKDELLSITAHEMRTPVTAIQGIIQSILRTMHQNISLSPEALKKRLQVIQLATDKLVLLSNNLGDVSKLQTTGYVQLPRKHHNLNDIVTTAIERLKNLWDTTSFTWNITLTATPLSVFVNGERIERALNNILENAVKYSLPGGTIAIETKHDGKYAILVIADQGVGIPNEEIERITVAFYRASNITSNNYAGIGLGLFLARTIIDAHNGTLHFNSENGRGTIVTIQIPLIG